MQLTLGTPLVGGVSCSAKHVNQLIQNMILLKSFTNQRRNLLRHALLGLDSAAQYCWNKQRISQNQNTSSHTMLEVEHLELNPFSPG